MYNKYGEIEGKKKKRWHTYVISSHIYYITAGFPIPPGVADDVLAGVGL